MHDDDDGDDDDDDDDAHVFPLKHGTEGPEEKKKRSYENVSTATVFGCSTQLYESPAFSGCTNFFSFYNIQYT